MLPAIVLSACSFKMFDFNSDSVKVNKKSIAAIILSFVPTILLNILITKDQKNASRTANMMALQEMDDYRNFADYSNGNKNAKSESKDKKTPQATPFKNITPPWVK